MEKERKYKIQNKERRLEVRRKLDLKQLWNEKLEAVPITQRYKDRKDLDSAIEEQAAIMESIRKKTAIEVQLERISKSVNGNKEEREKTLKQELEMIQEEADEDKLNVVDSKI